MAGPVPLPPSAAPPPYVSPPSRGASLTRPSGVTFACLMSVGLGCLGLLLSFGTFVMASVLAFIPVVGPILSVFFVPFILFGLVGGGLGVAAGVAGLQGHAWARWTMLVLFGLGAAFALVGSAFVLPLAVAALNGVAMVMLVNAKAAAWFDERARGG